jgi:hypothetical protein
MLPVTAGILGLSGTVAWWRAARRTGPDSDLLASAAVFVPLWFYLVASAGLFHHVCHFPQFLWALVPASAWWLQQHRVARVVAMAAWSPGVLLVLRSALITSASSALVTTVLPLGGSVVSRQTMPESLAFLQQLARSSAAAGRTTLIAPNGSGWMLEYGVPIVSRDVWFFAAEAIRSYDRQAFIDSLDRTGDVVNCSFSGATTDRPLEEVFPMDPSIAALVYGRLEYWKAEAGCRVWHVHH